MTAVSFGNPSLLARIPQGVRNVLLVGFETHPAANALAARPAPAGTGHELFEKPKAPPPKHNKTHHTKPHTHQ